jgi:hypothetical protein
VRIALKPGGRAFFVDSLLTQESTAIDHQMIDRSSQVVRKLNDGRTFRIVKVFYEPRELHDALATRGWEGYVRAAGEFFLYGCVARGPDTRGRPRSGRSDRT